MRADPQYKNWTIPENIDKMSAFMAYMSRLERNTLSNLGGSPLVAQGRHQMIELVGVHTELPLGHDHLHKCGRQGMSGIP
eukprot:12998161-Heterocapsa_arctica.AAC.1